MDPLQYPYAATAPQQLPPAGQTYPPQQYPSQQYPPAVQQGSFRQQPNQTNASMPINGDLTFAQPPMTSAQYPSQATNGTKTEGVHLSSLPHVLRDVLDKYDTNRDGILDHAEMMHARTDMAKMRQIVESGRVPMSSFPETARVMLEEHDKNGDGELDVVEIIHGFEALNREKRRKHQLMWFSTGLIVFSILLLIAVGGLMAYVIRLTKDTEVQGSVMYVKGTTDPIQTSASEFTVKNGMVVNRASDCEEGQTCENPLKVSQAVQTGLLSSRLPDNDLQELKQLRIANGESWIQFEVLAVARYAEDTSKFGTVVVIYTHIGELTLDGDLISFHEALEGAFSRAGFETVDSAIGARRRLLGVIQTIGMFNFLTTILDPDEEGQNITSEFIAINTQPFIARMQQILYCDRNGMQHCRYDGAYVDWVSDDNGDKVLQWTEQQTYYNDGSGSIRAKTIKTSAQYPSLTSHELHNGTHKLNFVEFGGHKWHCRVNADAALEDAVNGGPAAANRRAAVTAAAGAEAYKVTDNGVTQINGENVQHFTISGGGAGHTQAVQYYTKLDQGAQRLYQLTWEHMAWRFTELQFFDRLIPDDESEFDFANVECRGYPEYETPPMLSAEIANAENFNNGWGLKLPAEELEVWEAGLDARKAVEIALTDAQADAYYANLAGSKCAVSQSTTDVGAGVTLNYTEWGDCDAGGEVTGRRSGNAQTFAFDLGSNGARRSAQCSWMTGGVTLHYTDADSMYTSGTFTMGLDPMACFASQLTQEMQDAVNMEAADDFEETFTVSENPVPGMREWYEAVGGCVPNSQAQMGKMFAAHMFNTTNQYDFNNLGRSANGGIIYSLQGVLTVALLILSNEYCSYCQQNSPVLGNGQTIGLRLSTSFTGTVNWNMCNALPGQTAAYLPCNTPGASTTMVNWGTTPLAPMKKQVFPGESTSFGNCQGGSGGNVYRYQPRCFDGYWDHPSCTKAGPNDPIGVVEVPGTVCNHYLSATCPNYLP